MTTTMRPRARPRLLSHGAIYEAIQTADSIADAAKMLGVGPSYFHAYWVRNGRVGPSPAQRIKDRLVDKDGEQARFRKLCMYRTP